MQPRFRMPARQCTGPHVPARRIARGVRPKDAGQTALVLVIGITILMTTIGAVLVQSSVATDPLQQTQSVSLYANRALEAGVNSYLTAINQNPSLVQCSIQTNTAGTCQGLKYDSWNMVANSNIGSEGDSEWYAFGNPQPTFVGAPGASAVQYISVPVYGAAHSPNAVHGYLFRTQTIRVLPDNGFLDNIWWTNYESYNPNGEYWYTSGGTPTTTPITSLVNPISPDPGCYNYSSTTYTQGSQTPYSGPQGLCASNPVYFAPGDIVDGPAYSNDSLYMYPGPTFGPANCNPALAPGSTSDACYSVQTADPHCLFVSPDQSLTAGQPTVSSLGMDGSNANCGQLNSDALFAYNNQFAGTGGSSDTSTLVPPPANCTPSSGTRYNCTYSQPPQSNSSLSTLAQQDGCLYEGPTTIVLTTVDGVGQMTVKSPDDPNYPKDSSLEGAGNQSTCPTDGTAALPQNGVLYVESATGSGKAGANPFDGTSQFYPASTPQTVATCPGCYYGQTSSPNTEADAFVAGNLSGQLSIGSQRNIVIDGNLTYHDCTWSGSPHASACPLNTTGTPPVNDVLGLMADFYIEVDHPLGSLKGYSYRNLTLLTATSNGYTYIDCSSIDNKPGQGKQGHNCAANTTSGVVVTCPLYNFSAKGVSGSAFCRTPATQCPSGTSESLGSCDPANTVNGTAMSLAIDAAVLALHESFVVNNYQVVSGNDTSNGYLYVYGAIAQFARGAIGSFSSLFGNTGYTKYYTWDPLLDYLAPPSYLKPVDASWSLGTEPASTQPSTSACPSSPAPYGTGGTANDSFCATVVPNDDTTPLPNYH
jgi:hypothetical protein